MAEQGEGREGGSRSGTPSGGDAVDAPTVMQRPSSTTPGGVTSIAGTPGRYTATPGGDTDAVEPTPMPPTPSRSPRRIALPTGATLTEVNEARLVDEDGGTMFSPGENSSDRPRRVIWGTDANVDECFEKLTSFLRRFNPPSGGPTAEADNDDENETPYYLRVLEKVYDMEETVVNVDLRHVYAFDESLYALIVHYPTELIGIFDLALQDVYREMFEEDRRLEIRTFGLRDDQIHCLRKLDPTLINQVVGIRGMIIRCSQILPDLFRAFYRCSICAHCETRDVDRGRLSEPTTCRNCSSRGSFEMVHNRGGFNDKQMIRIQEAPESIPQGETPATVTVIAYDSLVDNVKPGDRVEVTGIFRAVPMRMNQRQRSVRNIFRTYIDLIHVGLAGGAAAVNKSILEDDTERDRRMHEIAASDNLYEKLAASVAPSIYGMDDVKKGVLLQLFGGSSKDFTDRGWGRLRSEVNILLVGDPGTSKSQILQYVHRLAPRGIYTSGSGSSAVGLTAYVTHDADSNELVLESGALVLSDKGVCCVDEFDKMSDFTRSILHEAMEQQTISVAKAGIIATLNARTSLLAAANPVNSRYDPKRTVVDNIQLPPTLLSRFDLIFLILDQHNVEQDRRLARHIVALFYPGAARQSAASAIASTLDAKTLTEYIAYARETVKPRLSDEAANRLVEMYVEMRKRGGEGMGGVRTVSATPRNLESLVRLSEASAKVRLSETVMLSDVDEAYRLMVAAIAQVATDPTTGMLDIDLLNAGQSAAQRNRVKDLANSIWSVITSWPSSGDIRIAAMLQKLSENLSEGAPKSGHDRDLKRALKTLEESDKISILAGGSTIRRLV